MIKRNKFTKYFKICRVYLFMIWFLFKEVHPGIKTAYRLMGKELLFQTELVFPLRTTHFKFPQMKPNFFRLKGDIGYKNRGLFGQVDFNENRAQYSGYTCIYFSYLGFWDIVLSVLKH